MRAYGKPRMPVCCPGHDTFSRACYNNRRSKKAHTVMSAKMHRIERRRARVALRCEIVEAA